MAISGTVLLPATTAVPVIGARAPLFDPRWIVVDTRRPSTVFLGGYSNCSRQNSGDGCVRSGVLLRSLNAGTTWQHLDQALAVADPIFIPPASGCVLTLPPLLIGSDGRYLFQSIDQYCTQDSHFADVLRSSDAGLHWQIMLPHGRAMAGERYMDLTSTPLSSGRLYALRTIAQPGGAYQTAIVVSNDSGDHWSPTSGDPTRAPGVKGKALPILLGGLVADPRHRDTLYAGLAGLDDATGTYYVAVWIRSDDVGATWRSITLPSIVSPGRLTLGTDPNLPGLLVARPASFTRPMDVRYISADGGRTWKKVRCPGDLGGLCPEYTLDNVFGAHRTYGVYPDGIHAFVGGGPAGKRLGISAHLPFPVVNLLAVAGGVRYGDPVYILGRTRIGGSEQSLLYRSLDAGQTWQRIL